MAVVNEFFVKKFFKPGENPIGHRFGSPGPVSSTAYEIVGVVENTAYTDARWKNHTMYFLPLLQRPTMRTTPIDKDESLFAGALVIQTDRPMDNMQSLARQTLAAINPQPYRSQVPDPSTNRSPTASPRDPA